MNSSKWRFAAGLAALFLLIAVAGRLLPSYWRNLEFQRALDQAGPSASLSDDALRARVANAAARLALPLRAEDIRVRRAAGRVEVEVLYVVTVGLPLYTVDLHFRPRAVVP
jgi:hypothetical protein